MKFYSQVGQDQFLLQNFFRGRRNGVFVDVGAYDGEKFSNSAFFERHMGWQGLCIEPLPAAFAKLAASRNCRCEQVCVADFEGEAEFIESDSGADEKMLSGLAATFDPRHVQRLSRVATATSARVVPVRRLSALLEQHALYDIDYCSIDTEGAELPILAELDLERFRIRVFTIENNYDDERIPQLMARKGYEFVAKLEQDYVFKRRDVVRLPTVSVICAVWHAEPDRVELLRRHAENLAAQSVCVKPIYVFDGADAPPQWLPGRKVCVEENLTIYQAWNVALALVDTPLVMNLNLDDRLAPDAVEKLVQLLARSGAAMVGGDWRICYSQADTDRVTPCVPAETIPFVPDWPPRRDTLTRLGSGTGNRGTLGPATLWRVDTHIGAPRYPWRLPEGTLLKSAADAAWWGVVTRHMGKTTARLPEIIGHYHSHPDSQAEFRGPADERALIAQLGVSLL